MLRLSPASGHPIRAFGIVGWSGAGKTTLIEHLLAQFASWGLSVSVIKHAHHGFDIDRPGKDSWRHREAGAAEVMLVSDQRWVLMHELHNATDNVQTAPAAQASAPVEPDLATLLSRLAPCDFVLVEGYKESHIPKIEVYRCGLGKPRFQGGDPDIVAVATDQAGPLAAGQLPLSDPQTIARFILTHLNLTAPLASTVPVGTGD
ncbi:MAG: molybdopterin-guanine dinucleotide biosynthesis protein B [Betaproteobacteria bacterium]|nr:molybdopterin-guanine dinucleotide biosynthesis protein B [Betaproteobacteria bacterium]